MSKVIILCASCGWKKVADKDETGLTELKNDSLSSKKYRCPGCGRGVSPRKFGDPQKEHDRKREEEKMKDNDQKWKQDNLDFHVRFMEEIGDEQ